MLKKTIVLFLCMLMVGAMAVASATEMSAAGKKPEDWSGTIRLAQIGYVTDDVISPTTGTITKGMVNVEKIIEAHYPNVDIQIVDIGWANVNESMYALIASNELDIATPAIRTGTPEMLLDLQPFFETDPEFAPENWGNIYDPRFVEELVFNDLTRPEFIGVYYEIPNTRDQFPILCDKEIFDHYGLEIPGDDYTLADLLSLAKQMTGIDPVTGKQTYGAHCGDYWFCADTLILFSSGVAEEPLLRIPDNDISKVDVAAIEANIKDNPKVVEAFEFWKEFINTMPDGFAAGEGIEKFGSADNDVAICVTHGKEDQVMGFISSDPSLNDRYVAIDYPKSAAGKAGREEFTGMGITVGCKDPELAWEIIKFYTTSMDVQNVICRNRFPGLIDSTGYNMATEYKFMADVFNMIGNGITNDDWLNGEKFYFSGILACLEQIGNGTLTPQDAPAVLYEDIIAKIESAIAQQN